MRLLVLLGPRARGDARPGSGWDLVHLSSDDLDVRALAADLVTALGTDDVDVVDLRRDSAVLRRDAGAEGVAVFEREPGSILDFHIEAAVSWCDMEAVLREAHADVLRAAQR